MDTPAAVRNLTTEEVAERLRVDPDTVKWWRRMGRGPRYMPGRPVTYRPRDVDDFERSRLVTTADQK